MKVKEKHIHALRKRSIIDLTIKKKHTMRELEHC